MKRPHHQVKDILAGPKKGTPATPAPADTTPPATATHRAPGRPPGPEASSKITVVFYDRQTRALDDLCHEIYGKTRTKITRTEIIRGMVDAILSAGIDLTGVTSEDDVRERLSAKLKRG